MKVLKNLGTTVAVVGVIGLYFVIRMTRVFELEMQIFLVAMYVLTIEFWAMVSYTLAALWEKLNEISLQIRGIGSGED